MLRCYFNLLCGGDMRSHRDLDVWKKSVTLVSEIYTVTRTFPPEEMYGLVNQMRRAAVSVPSNIAEGAARDSQKEFLRFLSIAIGSLAEMETQVVIAKNLKFLDTENHLSQEIEQIRRMLHGLINGVKRNMKRNAIRN